MGYAILEKDIGNLDGKGFGIMLKKINYVLDRRQKTNLIILLLVIFIDAFVELLGVSAILPIIDIAMDPDVINEKWYLVYIKEITQVDDANELLLLMAVGLIGVYVIKNIYVLLMYNMQYRFVFENQRKLAVRLMECYMNQNYLFHVSKNVAELQRNVTSDVNGFFTVVLNVLQFLAEISVCVVLIIFLLMKDVFTTLLIGGLVIIFVSFFAVFYKKVLGRKGEENRQINAQVTKWILQAFSGIKEIKVINAEEFFVDKYHTNYKKLATLQRQQSVLTIMPRPLMETVCISGLLLTVIVRISLGSSDIATFIPTLTVFALAAFRMLPSFNRMTGYLSGVMFSRPSVDAIYKDLQEVEELMGKRQQTQKKGEGLALNDAIRFEKLSFHYPESDKWILNESDLVIEHNTSIAFIGSSGAGKTTAADLLLGILEPQKGRITVDHVDISSHIQAWHESIGYIPQTIYLMDDTIRVNIAFGIELTRVDDEAVDRAVREAQLADFVASLPNGLDTVVGDRGVKLSGGQRQRIGIARALYRNPRVLVLDEATSALDQETEKEVMQAIDGLHGTRTLIIIAHRLSTISKCDRIYEVCNGGIVERSKSEVFGGTG